MIELKTIENQVQYLLEEYPSTRQSDHDLYVQYFETFLHKEFTKENFINQSQSFEGISRARRRVQEQYPELKDEVTAIKRADMELKYQEYYANC